MSKDLETISVLDDYLIVDTTYRRVCEVSNPIYDRMFRGSRFANEMATLLVEYRNRIAELEEQLKNAIVPKFKIGQNVWETRPFMDWEVTSIRFEKHNGILYEIYQLGHKGTDDYNGCVLPSDSDRFFATKEEAQAKLKELQGE